MAKQTLNYGVLKGTVAGHLRDADDDHYQILVSAGGAMFRIAVNVHSSLKPPDLLFQSLSALPVPLTKALKALSPGFKKLASQPGGLAQDFVRGGIVKVNAFKVVPGNIPGRQRPQGHDGRRRPCGHWAGRFVRLRVRGEVGT